MTAGLPFVVYFLNAYVLLPLLYRGFMQPWYKDHYYDLCPLVRCVGPLFKCLQEADCKQWLTEEIAPCTDESSPQRQSAAEKFWYVQHPEDPAYCTYQSFDRLKTSTALDFLECIGQSRCLKPSMYTDECIRSIAPTDAMFTWPFEKARYLKLYTTGWDSWPCQWTDFNPPGDDSIEPAAWMTQWPNAPGVWRMDLYWKNQQDGPVIFHMNNEMTPNQTWTFTDNEAPRPSTLRTQAVMWGTEARENWYLLDYIEHLKVMIIYYCAYTEAVDRFDSMTMVLQKDGADPITEEEGMRIESRVLSLLGEKHGRLQRIQDCH